MTVGAIKSGQVGQYAAVRNDWSGDISFFKRTFDPAVEDAFVPRRKLVTGKKWNGHFLDVKRFARSDIKCERFVVRTPGHD